MMPDKAGTRVDLPNGTEAREETEVFRGVWSPKVACDAGLSRLCILAEGMPQQACIAVLKQSLPSTPATAGCKTPESIASALQRVAGDGEISGCLKTQKKSTRCVFPETRGEHISHTGTAELALRGLYTRAWLLESGTRYRYGPWPNPSVFLYIRGQSLLRDQQNT